MSVGLYFLSLQLLSCLVMTIAISSPPESPVLTCFLASLVIGLICLMIAPFNAWTGTRSEISNLKKLLNEN